ncbi:MAG: hypothetical protein P4L16_03520 [Chlamydiales bacterium]|nr:hypothetical protein [Chlamydiales bacterium]
MFAFQCPTQKICIGPEGYYLKRMKEGGAWQSGTLIGVYGTYERIKPNSFYWGLIGTYANGRINGKSALGKDLASNFTDEEIEARLGFTIKDNCRYSSLFTPFIGYGYLEQVNSYLPPSVLILQFKDKITYFSFGFLSEVKMSKRFSIGLNVLMKWMLEGRCEVTGDPDEDDSLFIIENEMQYALELPIVYQLSQHKKVFTLSCVPFFQFRHYGGRENYPFDFIDTKFRVYGLRLLCNYWF